MSRSPSELKAEARAATRAAVGALEPRLRTALDERICGRIVDLEAYLRAEQIFAYSALADEVSLDCLIARAAEDAKEVFLPMVTGDSIAFFRYEPGQPLTKGRYGVLEPGGDLRPSNVETLVVVPGQVFDRQCGRIGRGGGYYDRFLVAKNDDDVAVGVGYACQLVDKTPMEAHDVRLDIVVTEQGALSPGSSWV